MNEVELSSFICDASALQMWEQIFSAMLEHSES